MLKICLGESLNYLIEKEGYGNMLSKKEIFEIGELKGYFDQLEYVYMLGYKLAIWLETCSVREFIKMNPNFTGIMKFYIEKPYDCGHAIVWIKGVKVFDAFETSGYFTYEFFMNIRKINLIML
jgi:hypothetical protein